MSVNKTGCSLQWWSRRQCVQQHHTPPPPRPPVLCHPPFFVFFSRLLHGDLLVKDQLDLDANVSPSSDYLKVNLWGIFYAQDLRSRLLVHQGRRCDLPLHRSVGRERWGAPVRLVEVDVKSPCPAGEDPLLGDEAVVAAPSPALVGNVHGALVGAARLVVMVGDGLVLRLPVTAARQERQLTFRNHLMSHLSSFFRGDLICIHLFVCRKLTLTNFTFFFFF